jgi:hypothetical protein
MSDASRDDRLSLTSLAVHAGSKELTSLDVHAVPID